MADLEPKKDVLDNLELLMNMEILKNEKDWDVIKSVDSKVIQSGQIDEKKDEEKDDEK
jgi:hypothetical protein